MYKNLVLSAILSSKRVQIDQMFSVIVYNLLCHPDTKMRRHEQNMSSQNWKGLDNIKIIDTFVPNNLNSNLGDSWPQLCKDRITLSYSGSKIYFTLTVVKGFHTLPNLIVVRVCIFACTRGNTLY